MLKKAIKVTAAILASALIITTVPVDMFQNTKENDTEYIKGVTVNYTAGAHAAIGETVVLDDTNFTGILVAAQDAPLVSEPENEYENIAIAQVNVSLNIRAEANEESEILGKLYTNGAATVLETLDGWYKITSGSVTGYVSADYVIVGDEEVCKAASDRIATVTTETLRFRKEPTTESSVLTVVSVNQKMTVLEEPVDGWVKVKFKSYEGYVSSDYVSLKTVYSYAESKEEEAARLAAEEEARRREAEAAAKKKQNKKPSSNKTYNPPSGGSGADVANYAVQFVGNPYVWGGSSLTNGADCSGFVMSVYAAFGVSLPHSSSRLRSVGYGVDASQVQAGDIICYSGHVAIYIGNGAIVHASNRREGIKVTYNWQYKNVLAIRRIF